MTGDVLLHIHNVHHYLEFFAVRPPLPLRNFARR
jgi:hypothetical protein